MQSKRGRQFLQLFLQLYLSVIIFILKRMETLPWGGNSQFCLFISFLKGLYSERKEFAPLGSKFFPFRIDPFSEGACMCRKANRKSQKKKKKKKKKKKWFP